MLRPLLLCALLAAGCATTDTADAPRRTSRPSYAMDAAGIPLAPDRSEARTIQLYAGQQQDAMPILALGTGQQLTLAFDLLGTQGRTLSVYYYHADRQWRRDLQPIEYMDGFSRDDLLRYELSRSTQTPYVHYEHQFPQPGSRFKLSGNYVVRVAEQGDEEAVLFERPFFVTEEAVAVEFGFQPILLGGGGGSSVQPIASFRPTAEGGLSALSYQVCFVQSGRFEAARCSDRPAQTDPGALTYYLQPQNAFRPNTSLYYADLRDTRVSSRIERVVLGETPYRVILSPDAALFPTTVGDPQLAGQVVTQGVRSIGDPATTGEYVAVQFAFVPPGEAPLRSVFLAGAFSGWNRLPEPMTWKPEQRHYEQTVLLKQGQYEYRYVSDDPALARAQTGVLGRPDLVYTALVYYRDPLTQSDRLIGTRSGGAPY